jgi:hypothetical protein
MDTSDIFRICAFLRVEISPIVSIIHCMDMDDS